MHRFRIHSCRIVCPSEAVVLDRDSRHPEVAAAVLAVAIVAQLDLGELAEVLLTSDIPKQIRQIFLCNYFERETELTGDFFCERVQSWQFSTCTRERACNGLFELWWGTAKQKYTFDTA